MTDQTDNRVPVSSRRARRQALQAPAPHTETGAAVAQENIKPATGAVLTEGQLRAAEQAEHKQQANAQNLLVPPTKEEKKVAAAKAPVAAFGKSRKNVRKEAQQANRVQADKEASELASVDPVLADLVPGEQPSLLQLRRMTKAQTRNVRDEATEAGKAAGKAVRDILVGRKLRNTPHQRHAKVASAQDALQQAGANANG